MNTETITSIRTFVQDGQLTGISFLTEQRPETVHPRVIKEGVDGLYVYGRASRFKRRRIEIEEFLTLLACGAQGLAVGGTRKSDGRQTSISFSKKANILCGPGFEKLLGQFA